MNIEDAQRQIDSLSNALRKAKESPMLSSNDPSLVELERIMHRKIEQLEMARTEEHNAAEFERLFFADIKDDVQQETLTGHQPRRTL